MKRWQIVSLMVVVLLLVGAVGYALGHRNNNVAQAPSSSASPSGSASPTASVSSTPTPTAGTPKCTAASLTASISAANSAAGTSYYNLILTNKGAAVCTVYGYPGVSLVDGGGHQLGEPAIRSGAVTPAILTLTSGKSAYSALGFPHAGNFEPGTCTGNAAGLKVYPPDDITALSVAITQPYCPGFSVSALGTTAN